MTKTLCAAHGAPLSECEQCRLSIPAFLRSGARNEAYSLEIAELRAKLADAERHMQLAYGWLWHSMISDKRTRIPRTILCHALTAEQRRAGIEAAKASGAFVSDADILRVYVEKEGE